MRTSQTHPLEIAFLPAELTAGGRLGMTLAPGKKQANAASGAWNRDLDADLGTLKDAGCGLLLSLIEDAEIEQLQIKDLPSAAARFKIALRRFPIPDVSTPRAPMSEFAAFIDAAAGRLKERQTVIVHCKGGLGRTGLVAASILIRLGRNAADATHAVRAARPGAIETPSQEEYVQAYQIWLDQLRGKYRGALLGLAAGDALGTTLEFKSPSTFVPIEDMQGGGPFHLKPGQWTDDTSMALCLAESLVETNRFDLLDQIQRYVRWWREGHLSSTGSCFDIGIATSAALAHFEVTKVPRAGSTDPRSAGNGSIMRLAPVPLFFASRPTDAIDRAAESSLTTHGATEAVDACRLLAGYLIGALRTENKGALFAMPQSPELGISGLSPTIDAIAALSFLKKDPPEIRGLGYVVPSLEAAMWAFARSSDFRSGALLAVNLGDDADTTGAIYGQLAGTFYGEAGIPEQWRARLALRELIEGLADRLFENRVHGTWV